MDGSKRDTVLCFGHDDSLRMTRQWLLERGGYQVIGVVTEAEFRQCISERCVSLVVFCHTILPAECARATAFVAEACPGARCLVLFLSRLQCDPGGGHRTLGVSDGPAAFMETVQQMLPVQRL